MLKMARAMLMKPSHINIAIAGEGVSAEKFQPNNQATARANVF
jgi:hypothetical protein